MSSTINGYEGIGRSLSLKLLHQLEGQSNDSAKTTEGTDSGFKKIQLNQSIRYASGDHIDNRLSRLPPCSECDLYYVNRDTLFSYHKDSELFLQVKQIR